MTRDVLVVPPELGLDAAWSVMQRRRIRHLPVVQRGVLLGILSDRDVLVRARLAGRAVEFPHVPVAEAMTLEPVTCSPTTTVADAVRTMTERKIDALPVVDARGALVGLVTTTDLLLLLLPDDEKRILPFDFSLEELCVA